MRITGLVALPLSKSLAILMVYKDVAPLDIRHIVLLMIKKESVQQLGVVMELLSVIHKAERAVVRRNIQFINRRRRAKAVACILLWVILTGYRHAVKRTGQPIVQAMMKMANANQPVVAIMGMFTVNIGIQMVLVNKEIVALEERFINLSPVIKNVAPAHNLVLIMF